MPINKEILKITSDASKRDGKGPDLGTADKPDEKGPDPGLVDKLFSEWSKYNYIRISIAAVAWGLGTSALLLA